jgi:hypothetical protein
MLSLLNMGGRLSCLNLAHPALTRCPPSRLREAQEAKLATVKETIVKVISLAFYLQPWLHFHFHLASFLPFFFGGTRKLNSGLELAS